MAPCLLVTKSSPPSGGLRKTNFQHQRPETWSLALALLMYVGVVELLRNLPLYGGGFDTPLIRDLKSRRDVLTGQSTGWALVNATCTSLELELGRRSNTNRPLHPGFAHGPILRYKYKNIPQLKLSIDLIVLSK